MNEILEEMSRVLNERGAQYSSQNEHEDSFYEAQQVKALLSKHLNSGTRTPYIDVILTQVALKIVRFGTAQDDRVKRDSVIDMMNYLLLWAIRQPCMKKPIKPEDDSESVY
jgi:hypothetical protein